MITKQISSKFVLKHNQSGLTYILKHKKDKEWYLSSNDGIVPSGQTLYGENAREIASTINCTLVD
jgi:hypothetical protein